MAQLVEDNLTNMAEWLNRIAVDDPKAAFQCMLSVMEFHMPKMSRITRADEPDDADRAKKSNEDIDRFLKEITEALEKEAADGHFPKFKSA